MKPQEKAWIKIYLNQISARARSLEIEAEKIQDLCAKVSEKIAKASL